MSIDREWLKNSIQKILKNSLDILYASIVAPNLFENLRSTLPLFNESKYLYYLNVCKEHVKGKGGINPAKMPSKPLLKLIDIFHENMQLLDYFKDQLDNLESLDRSLLNAFQLLQIVTEKRLKNSAVCKLNNEKNIYEICLENEKSKRNTKVLQEALKRKILRSKWKQAANEVLIQKYKKCLADCKCENNLRIKREIVLSSSSIRQIHVSSVTKQNELKEELQQIERFYENLLRENLSKEKWARNERNKLLSKLEVLIEKYDKTIAYKTKEHMDLQEEYEKRKGLFEKFLIAYYQQETEHERIVHAKKEEAKRHHEHKILLFMMNRSARVIQNHWRKFRRAKKRAAKKKSRGKSKKK